MILMNVNKLISIYNIIQMILIRNISKFPNITFVHKEFQYNLTYKDLFKEYNGKFGKIFLKKYQFIFDSENRLFDFINKK